MARAPKPNPTVAEIIVVDQCQFVWQTANGGWERCSTPADGGKLVVEDKSFSFCREHGRWSSHHMHWQHFVDRAWEQDRWFNSDAG